MRNSPLRTPNRVRISGMIIVTDASVKRAAPIALVAQFGSTTAYRNAIIEVAASGRRNHSA